MTPQEFSAESNFLATLASGTGLTPSVVARLVRSASHCYKKFEIPKRDGGRREIRQPSREIKLLQRWCIREVIARLPVHLAALAYRPMVGINVTAEKHSHGRFLLHLDFENFFPSITQQDLIELCQRNASRLRPHIQCDEDIFAFTKLVCCDGRLTIGAPSSPPLSNAVMCEFDMELWAACQANLIIYTRYADDLYFSSNTPGSLAVVGGLVEKALRNAPCPRLVLNPAKTRRSSKKRQRRVLGLVLSTEDRVSLGRERKRQIRARVYRGALGQLKPDEIVSLNGMLAFARSIEPDFVASLKRRYGDAVAQGIRFDPTFRRRGLRRQRRTRGASASRS